MRLLSTDTLLLESFSDPALIPPYAILSHRWGDHEVLFEDVTAHANKGVPKFDKVRRCCEQARKDGFQYVWIDTCCIDQRSSAELSESINSMYAWYTMSQVCYAYLQDVPIADEPDALDSPFRKSEWFRRGWTLQELIAPEKVVFLTGDWELIGSKKDLAQLVEAITHIDYAVLCGRAKLTDICAAKKMAWASARQTTKVEDRAYSLLGLFGVNMTTIYGEGERAFVRLQQEIMRQSSDHTIFAWEGVMPYESPESRYFGFLASSPDQFAKSSNITTIPNSQYSNDWHFENRIAEFHGTNAGLRIELPLLHVSNSVFVAALACKRQLPIRGSTQYHTVGLILVRDATSRYLRLPVLVNADRLVALNARCTVRQIYGADGAGGISNIFDIDEAGTGQYSYIMAEHMPEEYDLVVDVGTLRFLQERFGFTFSPEKSYLNNALLTSSSPFSENHSSVDPSTNEPVDLVFAGTYPGDIDQGFLWLKLCFAGPQGSLTIQLGFTAGSPYVRNVVVDQASKLPVIGRYLRTSRNRLGSPAGEKLNNVMFFSHRSHAGGPVVDVIITSTGLTAKVAKYLLEVQIRGK